MDEFPHKVFAGNLSFKTTEEELKEFFSPAGSVLKVNIITRGTRSLGYGFVAFSSEDECKAAVEKCHKKELGAREVNVELAKPKSELDAAKKERAAKRAAKAPKRRKRFNKKKAEGGESGEKQTNTESSNNKAGAADSDDKKKKKRKPKKKTPKDPNAPKPEPRARRVPTGDPSKTTVFVANLPFTLDDAGLSAVFTGYKVKTAKVVTRRGTGRSKGFGFVELEDESEQQKVLANTFTSEGRELNIKVALSDEKPPATEEAKA
jgi:RNA recognition motif-containing protein